MAAPWFFLADLPGPGETVRLAEDEAQHAAGARRLRSGDDVCLFDGAGTVAEGCIETIHERGKALGVAIRDVRTVAPLNPAVTVASAVPRGDRMAVLLSMIAQLGAAAYVPLQCERSVASPQRWVGTRGRRIVLEACKQSRCAYVAQLRPPMKPDELVRESALRRELVLVADPSGAPLRDVVTTKRHDGVTLVIGPEGGFTDGELNAMRDGGAAFISLGQTILRTETACVAFIAAIRTKSDA